MVVATPSTVDCVIPHEFHGTSTEVTVPPSSSERLISFRGSFNRSKAEPYILLGRMIEMIWSPVVTFRKMLDMHVVATALVRPLMTFSRYSVIDSSMPLRSITPPKLILQMMSQMV